VHIGYWYAPTASDPTADVEVRSGSLTEFSSILYDTTILPTLSRRLDVGQDTLDPRRAKYDQALQEFEDIARSSKFRGPKFVFAHIGIPHEPYVFDQNGNFVARGSGVPNITRFQNQVTFTNQKLEELIDRLLAATGRRAIIILQTDEGPSGTNGVRHLLEEGRLDPASRARLPDKFRILNAYYLPGVSADDLYPSITPVNTFRLVFDLYFDAGLGLLPDEIWATQLEPTRLVNITSLFEGG
jgi:hypothetical protein